MGKQVYITQEQFNRGFTVLARIGVKVRGMTIVKHVSGSSLLDKIDGYSSPSEYWKRHFSEDISPKDGICTSCMKPRKSFVVGHVEDPCRTKMWLYPVCEHCNKTYKSGKSSHLFYAYSCRLKEVV